MSDVQYERLPCVGGPLNHFDAHHPFPTRIPCSDGAYVLTQGYYYEYQREGRGPVGAKIDD